MNDKKFTDTEIKKACGEMCSDNRFKLIEKYKKHLIEHTNIDTAKDEVAVLDSLLFRCWQMGWLDKLEDYNRQQAEIERLNTVTHADAEIMKKLHDVAGLGFPVCKDARDLIIRISAQADYWQSEYEHLKLDRSMLEGHRYSFHNGTLTMIPKTEEKIIKDRAIKEFADKLDTYIMWHFPIDDPYVAGIRLKVSKLAKEMEGETDDS